MTTIPGTDLDLITITGTYLLHDGTPAAGTVVFTPTQNRLRDPDPTPTDGRIIVMANYPADLDTDGALMADGGVDATTDPFIVAATNDPDVDPTGWLYTIVENVSGMSNTFQAIIPFDAAGSTVDITELVPVEGTGGTVAVPLNVVGGVPTLIDDGAGNPIINPAQLPNTVAGVASVDGLTGTVVLTGIYAPVSHTHTASQITDGTSTFAALVHNHDTAYLDQTEGDARYILKGTPLYRPATQSTAIRSMYWGGNSGHPFVSVGTEGTVNVNNTTVYALGDRSIQLSIPSGAATTDVAAGAGGLTSFDATGLMPVVWLRLENPEVITSLRVWLGNAANNLGYVWQLVESSAWPYLADATGAGNQDGFVKIALPFGRTILNNAAPDLGDLGTIRVDCGGDGTAAAEVYWGGFGFTDLQNIYEQGVITLVFPGGRKSVLTQAKPYMDRRGYPGVIPAIGEVFRTPGTYGTDYLTLAEAHRLEDYSGWEVITYADTKALADDPDGYTSVAGAVQYTDMDAAKTYLYTQGFRSPDLLHYPQGAWNADARANAKSLFGLAVTGTRPTNETLPVSDPWKVRAFRVTSATTSGDLDTFVEQVRSSPGGDWGIVLIEDIVTTPSNLWEMSIADFQAFIDKIATEGVEVLTFSEILQGA